MKLAISNIAWAKEDHESALDLLEEYGIRGIEVAPTMVWPNWKDATPNAAKEYRKKIEDRGFTIPALQSIVYGKPELQLFDGESRAAFVDHFKVVAELGAILGAHVLVFGAPKQRKRGQLTSRDALKRGCDIMREIGEICVQHGVCIGWEHNPVEYGCDFITNAADAREFVDFVQSPGVQLHIDSAGLHLCGGDIGDIIRASGKFVHYHVSEPMLEPIAGGVVDHSTALQALNDVRYESWVSVEMKTTTRLLLDESLKKVTDYAELA